MRTNKLFTVIHAESEEQALRNAERAFNNGAEGIFLIDHAISHSQLEVIYHRVRAVVGDERFVGLNFLTDSPMEAARLAQKIQPLSALWLDDVGYVEDNLGFHERLHGPRILAKFMRASSPALIFGGLAFKGQRQIEDLTLATQLVSQYVDVVTTSGPRTGAPPTVDKLALMRQAIPEGQLAVASGMTPENVEPFLDYVDYFLVASGISTSFTELDPVRVRMMAHKMRR